MAGGENLNIHFYTIHRPDIEAAMIGIGADLSPGLHHPLMDFNKEALLVGVTVLTAVLEKAASIE